MLRFFAFSFALLFVLDSSARGSEDQIELTPRTIRVGQSARVDYGRLSLYRLKGDSKEMGRAAGLLAPREAFDPRKGMVPFMGTFVQNLLLNQDFVARNPWLKPMIGPFLDLKYYNKLGSKIPKTSQQFLGAMAEASGLSSKTISQAFMNPDVSHIVVADYLQGKLLPFPIPGPKLDDGSPSPLNPMPRPFGCTTFTVPPEMTEDGRFYVARVQDYPGVGKFDAYPSLYYLARKGAYRYVQVATAGIAAGAITAMNEHGLVVIMHTGMTLDATPENTPGLVTTQLMIEGASTIEDAKKICDAHTPAAGWIINLADASGGRARSAWLEVAPGAKECRLTFAEGIMVTNNHYRVADNLPREIKVGPSWDQNSPDRGNRARQSLEEKLQNGKLKMKDVVQVMADRMDLTLGRAHALAPAAVASLDQIKAVIFSPLSREIFVSDGQSPPSARGNFIRIRWDDFENLERFSERDASEDFRAEEAVRGSMNDLARYPSFDPYLKATLLLDGHGSYDVQKALPWLDQAVAAEPAEPLLRLMRGFLSARARKYESALADLDFASQNSGLDAHRRQVATLVRAKVLDVLGRRTESLGLYGQIAQASQASQNLRTAAEKFLKTPASRESLDHLGPDAKMFDFSSYD
jgi:hypothetical protein